MIQLSYMAWMDADRQYQEWLEEREKRREEEEKNKEKKDKDNVDK